MYQTHLQTRQEGKNVNKSIKSLLTRVTQFACTHRCMFEKIMNQCLNISYTVCFLRMSVPKIVCHLKVFLKHILNFQPFSNKRKEGNRILKINIVMLHRLYASNPKAVHFVRKITHLSHYRQLLAYILYKDMLTYYKDLRFVSSKLHYTLELICI